jgi:chromosome segregation ATPase
MRKVFVVAVIAALGLLLAVKTSFLSYAGTLWGQIRAETKKAIPTRFELQRARHELAKLDGDIDRMIRPIAEYKTAVGQLQKEIGKLETSLSEQKPLLVTMAKDLESNPKLVLYQGEEFAAERVRQKLQRDFESYQRMEKNLASQRKLLEAREASLRAAQDQLAKVIAKKKEFELRIAQLEADEETLQIARIGTKLEFDDSRATQIEVALADIEQRQTVQRTEIELKTQTFANDNIPVGSRRRSAEVDAAAIRRYLEGGN